MQSEEAVLPRDIDDHLRLTLPREEDAEELFDVTDRNRAYLREWLPWVDGTRSRENSLEFIRATVKQHEAGKGFQALIRVDDRIVGCIGYHDLDQESGVGSIGYWLDENFQGQGIMTRACRVLVDLGFEQYGLRELQVHCAVENLSSQGIPKRLGFSRGDMLPEPAEVNGRSLDMVVYFMNREEWTGR